MLSHVSDADGGGARIIEPGEPHGVGNPKWWQLGDAGEAGSKPGGGQDDGSGNASGGVSVCEEFLVSFAGIRRGLPQ